MTERRVPEQAAALTKPINKHECPMCGEKFSRENAKDIHMLQCLTAQDTEPDYPKATVRSTQTKKDKRETLLYVERAGEFRGYKKEILKEELLSRFSSFLTCSVCQGIIREARSMGDTQKLACMVCTDKNNSNAFPTSDEAVGNLVVHCPLRSRGCQWEGRILFVEKHVDTCNYFISDCPLGCGFLLNAFDMGFHKSKDCPNRKVACEHCSEFYTFKGMSSHHKICEYFPINCRNKCGNILKRSEMGAHLQKDCQNTRVSCPNKKYGCDVTLARRELAAHTSGDRLKHMELKTDFIEKKMDSEIQKLKTENESLRKELEKVNMILSNRK